MKSELTHKSQSQAFTAALAVLCITALIIVFNGGIQVGYSNHVGLVPVVRRLLDPNYLPNDFGIAARFYHHRVFGYLIAGLTKIIGEDNALILLCIVGMTLLSASLFYLSKALGLPLSAFLVAGLFLATSAAWTGLGLEINYFVGNPYIMPPTFAHAFVLFGIAALIEPRYRMAAFMSGMTVFFHLQIGLIFGLVLAPFYAAKLLKKFEPKEFLYYALLSLIPASFSLLDLMHMMQRGLLDASFSLYYIDFRQPHHFELRTATAALWISIHIIIQILVYLWLRWRMYEEGSRKAGVLMAISLMIAALCLLHFLDYHYLKLGSLVKIQFLRMSPLISVLGTLAFLMAVHVWETERAKINNRAGRFRFVNACLILAALPWAYYNATAPRSNFYVGIRRYAERGNNWTNICRWIREHGPTDSIYLTPPGEAGFVYLTNRSNVVEYKINPDGAQMLTEWFERLRDMSGGELPQSRGFENNAPLNKAYAALKPEQLLALSDKYGAKYAVLPSSSTAQFEVLYQNEGYRLVKLK